MDGSLEITEKRGSREILIRMVKRIGK